MSLDHAILGFLKSRPMSGYDLKTRGFDQAAAQLWTADQAQIYRTLERLERAGMVSSRLIPQPGRPDRREFASTPAGVRALTEWLETPHPLPPLRDPFLLQTFFAAALTDAEILALLGTARDGYERRLTSVRASLDREETRTREGAVRALALTGAAAQAAAALGWIDEARRKVTEGMPVNGRA
jgi:PadR family transcriptional regulator, regulatory protein AphA